MTHLKKRENFFSNTEQAKNAKENDATPHFTTHKVNIALTSAGSRNFM